MKTVFKAIFVSAFLMALAQAIPAYIRSSFLEEFIDVRYIGFVFTASSILTLSIINFLPRFISRYSNYRVAIILLIVNLLALAGLIFSSQSFWLTTFFIILEIAVTFLWINMDLFVERFSKNVTTGKTRAYYFTVMNFGYLASPIIAGYLVGENNYRAMYIAGLVLMIVVALILLGNKHRLQENISYKHGNLRKVAKKVFYNSNLRGIFGVTLLLQFFYAVAVLFMPIYLNEYIGFSWQEIGYIFTFMLLPFVLLQIPAGMIADKHHNERKILLLGFMIMIASTVLFSRFDGTSAVSWALILFLGRCGAALIEIMKESYFFKLIDVEDVDFINFFRNIRPAAYLLGSLFSVLVLKFFALNYLFLFLAIILFSAFYFIWKMKRIE